MHDASITNTVRNEFSFGPPAPSDCRGLVPTMAAIVQKIDAERHVRWLEQVKRQRTELSVMLRRAGIAVGG